MYSDSGRFSAVAYSNTSSASGDATRPQRYAVQNRGRIKESKTPPPLLPEEVATQEVRKAAPFDGELYCELPG